jgi:hypothetical protein
MEDWPNRCQRSCESDFQYLRQEGAVAFEQSEEWKRLDGTGHVFQFPVSLRQKISTPRTSKIHRPGLNVVSDSPVHRFIPQQDGRSRRSGIHRNNPNAAESQQ